MFDLINSRENAPPQPNLLPPKHRNLTMSHIPSRSERSKMTLKPQPLQRYHHPDAEVTEEMEVDMLVTPKANSTATTSPTTRPESPTPLVARGSTSKALPSGLNFSKAVTAGTLLSVSRTKHPYSRICQGGRARNASESARRKTQTPAPRSAWKWTLPLPRTIRVAPMPSKPKALPPRPLPPPTLSPPLLSFKPLLQPPPLLPQLLPSPTPRLCPSLTPQPL